jgi:hypothetical protein
MDNLEEFARQRFDFNRQRLTLKEQQEQRLTVPHNGGLFCIDITLISYLQSEKNSHIYLQDSYGNPIHVDRQKLLTLCRERFNEVMNDWHDQFDELKKVRKIRNLNE